MELASNQAFYLDDQMSGWRIENNTFEDCQVGTFVGGGRGNVIRWNRYVRVGTVQYFNDQGATFDNATVSCDDVRPPFNTSCNTGAAIWMAAAAVDLTHSGRHK